MSEAEQDIDEQDIASETPSAGEPVSGEEVNAAESKDGDQPANPGQEQEVPEEELDPLEAAVRDAAMWREVALRSKAELENYRKRMTRERSDAIRYANAELLETLFPVLDNFGFGLEAAKAEQGSIIYQGMQMVHKQMQEFLDAQGVEVIDAVGQPFDPNVHDAVAQQPSDEVPEGTVTLQVRRGYRMHDRLLRPASVHVSTGPASADAESAPNADSPSAGGGAQPS